MTFMAAEHLVTKIKTLPRLFVGNYSRVFLEECLYKKVTACVKDLLTALSKLLDDGFADMVRNTYEVDVGVLNFVTKIVSQYHEYLKLRNLH